MPESHSISQPNLKLSKLTEILPTHTNTSPQTTTMNTLSQLRGPFPQPHPPNSSPNFIDTTLLQIRVSSTPKRHSHLPNRALLKVGSFLIPKPPLAIRAHTLSHPTVLFAVFHSYWPLVGMVKSDKKQVGRLDNVLLISNLCE